MRPSRSHVLYQYLSGSNMSLDIDCNTQPAEQAIREYQIAFLGSSKVGKTTILRQFLCQEYDERYVPTTNCQRFRKAVFMGDRLYDMILKDCPGVSYFPKDSAAEWADYKGYSLHLSRVFVLVYDVTNADTFEYVRRIREQILEYVGPDALMLVIGCKQDLVDFRTQHLRTTFQQCVKKWKCAHILCSAKYNWHIVGIFKEILRTIELQLDGTRQMAHGSNNRWRLRGCNIS